MELSGNVPCQSSKEQLWAGLFNPEVWKETIPEAERYEEVGDNQYEMDVMADIGPIKGKQTLKIQFSELQPPTSCNFELSHQLVKSAKGTFELKDPSEVTVTGENEEAITFPDGTQTVLSYNINADAGNPIFNAVLEGFKAKIKEGFDELLGRMDENSRQS